MGADTNVLLTDPPEVLDLLRYASRQYKDASLHVAGADLEHYYLHFTDGVDRRMLAVFPPGVCAGDYADICVGPAMLISMGCWGNSEAIARRLAIKFGGLTKPNDCRDDWQGVRAGT